MKARKCITKNLNEEFRDKYVLDEQFWCQEDSISDIQEVEDLLLDKMRETQ